LLGLSALVGVGGWMVSGWLLAVLDTPPEIVGQAQAFLRINFAGTVFLVGYNFVGTLLRAFGNSRTPLYFVMLATVLAGALAPLLIEGLGLGIAGAAWAMVLAQGAAFVYSLVFLARRPREYPFRPRLPGLAEFRTILELGVPSGVQLVVS